MWIEAMTGSTGYFTFKQDHFYRKLRLRAKALIAISIVFIRYACDMSSMKFVFGLIDIIMAGQAFRR
jgi:hypothetical protein